MAKSKKTAEVVDLPQAQEAVERVKPLTAEAWELYHQPLDNSRVFQKGDAWIGTTRAGFLPLRDIRRISNKLAGGPGEILEPPDFVYIHCVDGTMSAEEVLNHLMPAVNSKMARQANLLPEELLAHLVLDQKKNLIDALEEVGTNKEKLELRKLVKPLDADILNQLVHPDSGVHHDGGKRRCAICADTEPVFQTMVAYKLHHDLSQVSLKDGLEAAFVKDRKTGKPITVGSYVLLREYEDNDKVGKIVVHPFHGNAVWAERVYKKTGWEGPSWLLGEWVKPNRRGHLAEARLGAASQENEKGTFAFCMSEESALDALANAGPWARNRANEQNSLQFSKEQMQKKFRINPDGMSGGLGRTQGNQRRWSNN